MKRFFSAHHSSFPGLGLNPLKRLKTAILLTFSDPLGEIHLVKALQEKGLLESRSWTIAPCRRELLHTQPQGKNAPTSHPGPPKNGGVLSAINLEKCWQG